jgi:DNA-binding NtrC family response regulator
LELVRHLRSRDSGVSLVGILSTAESDFATEAFRAGIYDCVTRPLELDQLARAVARACERRILVRRLHALQNQLTERDILQTISGSSPLSQELGRQVERALHGGISVCVTGESGSGKEFVARAIHAGGPRRHQPFVVLNCAAVAESRQESELFGADRGALGSGTLPRQGRLEEANGGTIFLNEVDAMSPTAQASMLRMLQEGVLRRMGGSEDIPVDVRIVCATSKDLGAAVDAGRFRADLFQQLTAYPIRIAPLRERPEDIPQLVAHFLQSQEREGSAAVSRVSPDVMEALTRYDWPGNVRELENVILRSLLAARGGEITLADLPPAVRQAGLSADRDPDSVGEPAAETSPESERVVPLRELERRAIEGALRSTHGSVGKAAKLLGIGRATLYRRLATLDPARQRPE